MENKRFRDAYLIKASATVDSDWEQFGLECLLNGDTDTAKRCFMKIKAIKWVDLTAKLESMLHKDKEMAYLAEIYCFLVRNGMGSCYICAHEGKI